MTASMRDHALYPATASARDRFVLERRSPRPQHDPWRYQGLIVEEERTAQGGRARMATVLLTGRECPWRCTMCDLWTYTTVSDTPPGAIAAQVAAARSAVRDEPRPVTGMKLYNAGSFFDPRAVPEADYDGVAGALAGLSRVIVESHPALVGPRVDRLLAAFARQRGCEGRPDERSAQLEVAMGLETAHPVALDRLNKRFTLDHFARAARALDDRGVALRVFLLISPPFVPLDEQDAWLLRSVDAAFSCGASVVSLVPTRPGNGAIDALAEQGSFRAPDLEDIERSFALALSHARRRGRVFVDVWDLERFSQCPHCAAARRGRLQAMNLEQRVLPQRPCPSGDHGAPR
jgi:radical SAM enzyme (TIGR01210 family)